MTDLRKAAEMALEALDYHFDNVDEDAYWPYVLEAKQALRQALAQPEQDHIRDATENVERKWVGLTDEEIHEIVYEQIEWQHPAAGFRVANCIEAKLKEKNT